MFAKTLSNCLWEHLNVGRQILLTGSLPQVDPWSYLTTGQQWLSYNWLFEAMLAQVYSAAHGQVIALTLLKLSLVLILTGLLLWQLLRSKVAALSAVFLLFAALPVLGSFLFELRPHLATAIFFAAMLIAMDRADDGDRRWILGMPLAIALWCNCHGGFIAGVASVFLWCIGDVIDECFKTRSFAWPRLAADTLLLAACVAAVFVNPFGARLPLLLVQSLMMPRPEFADWRPVSMSNGTAEFYFLWLAIMSGALIFSRQKKSIAVLCVLVLTAAMPLSASRNLMLFILACLVLGAKHFQDVLANKLKFDGRLPGIKARHKFIMGGGAIAASVFLLAGVPAKIQAIPLPADVPVKAVALLQAVGATGNLATSFDWGDYCIWHLTPNMRVSSDGRREAAYSQDAIAANLRFACGAPGWDKVLTQYKTAAILVPPDYAAFTLLSQDPEWQLCYQDAASAIFAPRHSELARRLTAPPNVVTSAQFP